MTFHRIHPGAVKWILFAVLGLSLAACGNKESKSPEHADHEQAAGTGGKHGDEHEDAPGTIELRPEAAKRTKIVTAKVAARQVALEIHTTGQIGFDENRVAHVSPLVDGRVHKVTGRLGQMVEANEAVAEINSMELGRTKAAYLQAKARRDLTRATYEREKGLSESKISSEQEMMIAKSAYLQAKADFDAAAQTLRLFGIGSKSVENTNARGSKALFQVRAPIAGKVVEKHITLGELVTPASKLFTIADLSSVWIWIDIYERNIAAVHLQDIAYVTADSYPGKAFEGRLTYIMDSVDVDTRTVRARIELANPEGVLRPGMFVRVRLADPHGEDTTSEAKAVLAIPKDALLREGDASVVFVKLKENHYQKREVEVGRLSDEWGEITSGLAADEEVVVEGGFLLKSEASKADMGGGHSH
tara:strand:- start:11280 stop:12530 length:1251 start_codon:yes stop_codon:yes gene_type:complete